MVWNIHLLLKYVSLMCSFPVMLCHAHITQALKEATMMQASKQDIKLALDWALIRCSSDSKLSSRLHTAITAM